MTSPGILSVIILSGAMVYAMGVVAYLTWTKILRSRIRAFLPKGERSGRNPLSLVTFGRNWTRKSRG